MSAVLARRGNGLLTVLWRILWRCAGTGCGAVFGVRCTNTVHPPWRLCTTFCRTLTLATVGCRQALAANAANASPYEFATCRVPGLRRVVDVVWLNV